MSWTNYEKMTPGHRQVNVYSLYHRLKETKQLQIVIILCVFVVIFHICVLIFVFICFCPFVVVLCRLYSSSRVSFWSSGHFNIRFLQRLWSRALLAPGLVIPPRFLDNNNNMQVELKLLENHHRIGFIGQHVCFLNVMICCFYNFNCINHFEVCTVV